MITGIVRAREARVRIRILGPHGDQQEREQERAGEIRSPSEIPREALPRQEAATVPPEPPGERESEAPALTFPPARLWIPAGRLRE